MKPESLHALLIDRELGELTAETAELLEAWLGEHPESAAASASIRQTLQTARGAMRKFPELARPEPAREPAARRHSNIIHLPALPFRWAPLAWAAALVILVGAAGWIGFRAGWGSAQNAIAAGHPGPAVNPSVNFAKQTGPWARYALASNPGGGLTVLRLDPQ